MQVIEKSSKVAVEVFHTLGREGACSSGIWICLHGSSPIGSHTWPNALGTLLLTLPQQAYLGARKSSPFAKGQFLWFGVLQSPQLKEKKKLPVWGNEKIKSSMLIGQNLYQHITYIKQIWMINYDQLFISKNEAINNQPIFPALKLSATPKTPPDSKGTNSLKAWKSKALGAFRSVDEKSCRQCVPITY